MALFAVVMFPLVVLMFIVVLLVAPPKCPPWTGRYRGGPAYEWWRRHLIVVFVLLALAGCTQQERARRFGGTATVDLPPGRKLVMVTWKEDSLWYMTRVMVATDVPERYTFQESGKWGLIEGTVEIQEHR